MRHEEDAGNDFGLLFDTEESKYTAKRRCRKLIQSELEKNGLEADTIEQEVETVSISNDVDDPEDTSESIDGHVTVDETDTDENHAVRMEEMLRKLEIENDVYQRVFLVTLESEETLSGRYPVVSGKLPACLVFLPQLAAEEQAEELACWLNANNVDGAILERLQMPHPELHVVWTRKTRTRSESQVAEATEMMPIKYLAACYDRAVAEIRQLERTSSESNGTEVARRCAKLAVTYAGTYLTNPQAIQIEQDSIAVSPPQPNPHHDLFNLMMAAVGYRTIGTASVGFFEALVEEHRNDLDPLFSPVLKELFETVCQLSLHQPSVVSSCFGVLDFITRHSPLACVLTKSNFWLPPAVTVPQLFGAVLHQPPQGTAYEDATLLGRLLGLTCIPRPLRQSEFFLTPSQQSQAEMDAMTASLRQQFSSLTDALHRVLRNLLRSPETKTDALKWVVNCMRDNVGRKQLMADMQLLFPTFAGDGFFLNLCAVLLKLCDPFTSPTSTKLMKLESQYCSRQAEEQQQCTAVLVFGLNEETKLSVQPADGLPAVEGDFNFMTQMFFITHRCLQLGLSRVCSHYKNLMQQLAKLQQRVQAAMAGGGEPISALRRQFEAAMTHHLSYKAQLLNSSFIEAMFQFYVTTARWLTHLAVGRDISIDTKAAETTFFLPETASVGLCHVPEFVVEGLVQFVTFVRQFSETTLEDMGDHLHHLLTFVTVFMGNAECVHNPHLRASMAEMLHLLMPKVKNPNQPALEMSSHSTMQRTRLFEKHSFAHSHLAESLFQIFVDIEFTGHAMQFEQKFSYRYPMYHALEYMWELEPFRKSIAALADKSVRESGQTKMAPLFIRFINMLLNDAIFLLDEALQYLVKVKEGQLARDRGDWSDLSNAERQERESNFAADEHMARGNNFLGNETVKALCSLTEEIHEPFVLPSMVDRVVAMLNYFLVQLVGPKMGAVKVKNFEKYNFKPQELVASIVRIYVNLSCKEEFCAAIPRDGRSYSRALFSQARSAMHKICKSDLAVLLSELHEKVKYYDAQRQQKEEAEANAPDEFRDPITDEVMADPVKLPSSGVVVDRPTIERHLLSDQLDPFNRSPLTIDEVVPEDDLKEKIARWRKDMGTGDSEDLQLSD